MQNKIIDIKDKNSLSKAAHVLKTGGILVFPTDTVYGIGCLLNKGFIKELYRIKNRPLTQPTGILLNKKSYHNFRSSIKSGTVVPGNLKIKRGFANGSITIVFPKKYLDIQIPKILLKDDTLGVRLPKDRWLEKLIDQVGPIVASSANKKGERPPQNFTEINPKVIKEVGMIIQTDKNLPGKPSQVYDLKSKKYIRI